MREAINKCKSQIQYIIFSPKNILPFLQAGRLCHVVVCLDLLKGWIAQ